MNRECLDVSSPIASSPGHPCRGDNRDIGASAAAFVDHGIDADRAYELMRQHGYLVIRDAVDGETIAAMRRELRPFLDAAVNCRYDAQGTATKRFKGAFAKSISYHKFALNPLILALADRILLPNCASYTLAGSTCFEVGPGAGYQPLHRDDMIWPLSRPCPELMINVMCAISDFTAENGATRVVPGSHRWPQTRVADQQEAISAVMPSGSLLVIFGSTLHGAGKNTTTDEYRMSVSGTYALGWLRQQDSQYLFAPPHVARKFPDAFARLVGYQSHGHLGQVHIEKDLHEVLGPEGDVDIAHGW